MHSTISAILMGGNNIFYKLISRNYFDLKILLTKGVMTMNYLVSKTVLIKILTKCVRESMYQLFPLVDKLFSGQQISYQRRYIDEIKNSLGF